MDREIMTTNDPETMELEELNRKVSERRDAAAVAADRRKKAAAIRHWEQSVMRAARRETAQRRRRQEWRQIRRIARLVAVAAVVHIGRVAGCIDPGFALLVQVALLAGCFLHAGSFFEIRRRYAG